MAAQLPSHTPSLADAFTPSTDTDTDTVYPGLVHANALASEAVVSQATGAASFDSFPFDRIAALADTYPVLAGYEIVGMMAPQPTGTAFRARHRATGEAGELRFYPGPDTRQGAGAASARPEARASDASGTFDTSDVSKEAEGRAQWRNAVAEWNRTLHALTALQAHPNIQGVLAFGEIAGGYYVLLQAVEGRALRQILETEGARSLAWTLALAAQIAQALDFAAAHGLAHGSLNPDTIVLYGEPPVARLREFGMGSLNPRIISAYTSPEQTAGHAPDARSDIYAFGTVLYACLSARPPFGGRTREELCRNIQTTYPPPLLEQPVWARDALARAMQRGPAHRYRLAVELVTDLQFQRSPAPLVLEPVAPDADGDKDWTLGRGMPAMALVEPDALASAVTPTRKTGLLTRLLGRGKEGVSDTGSRLTLLQQIAQSLGLGRNNTAGHTGFTDEDGPLPDGVDVPIHGFLGRFNRYMALQQYVTLPPDDPRKRGWRGLLLRAGVRWPMPPEREAHAAIVRLPAGLVRAIDALWRVGRTVVPLALLGVCAHALMLVNTRRFVYVEDVRGRPTLNVAGIKTALHAGDTVDARDLPQITTDSQSEITLRTTGVWMKVMPGSELKFARLDYSPTRARRVELLSGQAWLDLAPPASVDGADGSDPLAGQSSRFDVQGGGAQVRTLPGDLPALLQIAVARGRAQVRAAQGQARVYSAHGAQRVRAGQQFSFAKDSATPRVTPLTAAESKTLRGGFAPSRFETAQAQGLVAAWRGLSDWYQHAQERLVMPRMDSALTALHLQPGAQGAFEEARAYTSARIALDAITKSLAAEDFPASLDMQTLADTGLEAKDRNRLLQCFDGKRLLAYKRLDNGGCVLLARVNNDAKTLLKATNGTVTSVAEDREEAELAKADGKQ